MSRIKRLKAQLLANHAERIELEKSLEKLQKKERVRKAREYVIDAISKANKGDNGFKLGEINYFFIYSFNKKTNVSLTNDTHQVMEGCFYLRSGAHNIENLDEFKQQFEIMLEV